MPFPWMAAATLGAGFLSSAGQRDANRANRQLARDQMAFQERMSSTAYQRASKDLEAAGLNRILALGSPASSPGGQTAVMQNEKAPIANATAQAAMQAAQIQLIKAQTKKTQNEARALEPKAEVMESVGQGIETFKGAIPKRLSPREIDYANVISSFKNQLSNRLEAMANSARSIRDNARQADSVTSFFQDRKPTRQEASHFQNVWNSLPRHWDEKRKMWHMVEQHQGRWPDWAMELLRKHYPEAREK
ncbi:DNA pilot protein [Microviridae sp.]|nr:DNA pilot protein [Microviridae sp.]